MGGSNMGRYLINGKKHINLVTNEATQSFVCGHCGKEVSSNIYGLLEEYNSTYGRYESKGEFLLVCPACYSFTCFSKKGQYPGVKIGREEESLLLISISNDKFI